jgi:hypothetical protein
VLFMDGEEYSILTNPLEPYLALNPGKRPHAKVEWSDLWRGYIASWKIESEHLWLRKIEIREGDAAALKLVDATQALFPGEREVPADWFTGYLVIPTGKLIEYVHMGYASTYKRYLILRIDQGVVTERRPMSAAQFRKFRVTELERER